jgi:superfamily II DNA or RNA helicase
LEVFATIEADRDVARLETALRDSYRRLTEAARAITGVKTLDAAGAGARQVLRSVRLEVLNTSRALVASWARRAVGSVVDYVEADRDSPTLVFCDDRAALDAIVAGLDRPVGVLDGRSSPAKRDQLARAFQAGELDVLCVSKAGSVGLNLQRARRIVLADLPLHPSLLRQRVGRAARGGHDGSTVTVATCAVGTLGRRAVQLLAGPAVGADIADDGAGELALVATLCARSSPRSA